MTIPFEPHWVQRPGTRVAQVHRPVTVEQTLQLLREDRYDQRG